MDRPTESEEAMATTFVLHRVRDYDAWRQVYDGVADVQKTGGVVEEAVYRSESDPNTVLVMHRFGTREQAHAFFEGNPALMDAMMRAGVDAGSLRIEFFDEA
jgi:hypothetical protein